MNTDSQKTLSLQGLDFFPFISQIFYINLERRVDRRTAIEQELCEFDFPQNLITRFQAIEDAEGCIGCSKSHLAVLRLAQERRYENVIIFEDDFQFIIDKTMLHANLHEFFIKYGEKFDVLMLSYNLHETEPVNDLVGYCRKAQTASGYIVNHRVFDELIQMMETALQRLIATHQHWLYVNDVCWFPLQKTREWYYLMDKAGVQRPGFSDLANQIVDYKC